MEETYVADELKYCEVWTIKDLSSHACTMHVLANFNCPCQGEDSQNSLESQGKTHLSILSGETSLGPLPPSLRNYKLRNDP